MYLLPLMIKESNSNLPLTNDKSDSCKDSIQQPNFNLKVKLWVYHNIRSLPERDLVLGVLVSSNGKLLCIIMVWAVCDTKISLK